MSERINTIDYIKAIAVLGVIADHLLHKEITAFMPIITNFYIPVFFICSGFTTSPDKEISIKKKAYALLVPYMVYWIVFTILGGFGFCSLSFRDIAAFFYSRSLVNNQPLMQIFIGPTWFLTAMFVVWVEYKSLERLKMKIMHKFILTAALGVILANVIAVQLPWSLENSLLLLSYIYMGQLLRERIKNKRGLLILCLLIGLYTIGALYNGQVNLSLSIYGHNLLLCWLLPIVAFYVMQQLFTPPYKLAVNGLAKFLLYVGQNSLTIFLGHMLFYLFFHYVINLIFANTVMFQHRHFLIQGVIVLLTILCTLLTCKWQNSKIQLIIKILNNGNSHK